MKPWSVLVVGALGLALAADLTHAQTKGKAVSPPIENGSKVELEYTLKDDDGKVMDTNKGAEALSYTHGQQQIIPGLEQALTGMRAGDEKKVTVKPEEGYGPLDPAAQTEVPKEAIPPDALKVGTTLMARGPSGETRPVRVKAVKDKTVVIDLNHPLAGKTLHFDIKILGVQTAPK